MFKHNGVQNIFNEEIPSWNKIKPSIFDSPLQMLYSMGFFIIGFQHYFAPYILYIILQILFSNEY